MLPSCECISYARQLSNEHPIGLPGSTVQEKHHLSAQYLLWSPYGMGQTTIFLPCGFFFLSFFLLSFLSPNLSGWRSDAYNLPYFHTWCGFSANLGCRSETCCTRLAENAGRKKSPKIAICAPSYNLSGYIFRTKARIDNRKKVVKQQYLLQMSSQYGELRPTSG